MGRDAAEWVIKKLQGKKDLKNSNYYLPELVEGRRCGCWSRLQ